MGNRDRGEGFTSQDNEPKREIEPRYSDLVIFTSTLQRGGDSVSQQRKQVAGSFFDNASKLTIHCCVVDAGSDSDFLDYLRGNENIELQETKVLSSQPMTMGQQRRAALDMALKRSQSKYFLWTEPEKDGLINPNSLDAMLEDLRKNEADIIVPKRTSLESYPHLQQWIEKRANRRASVLFQDKKFTDAELDLWFGPKMFNRSGAEYFAGYQGKLDQWDAIIVPVLNAAKEGKRIESVDVVFSYPKGQGEVEKRDRKIRVKRVEQYVKILEALGDEFWVRKIAEYKKGH